MRSFEDHAGRQWQVAVGKASYGSLMLLFSAQSGDDMRTSPLSASTHLDAEAELRALDDDELRSRLDDAEPWT